MKLNLDNIIKESEKAYKGNYPLEVKRDFLDLEIAARTLQIDLQKIELVSTAVAEAEKRRKEFESCPTSIDYDNDCDP